MGRPKQPWTDPDPQPGDFDSELDSADSEWIEIHDGNPNASLAMISPSGQQD